MAKSLKDATYKHELIDPDNKIYERFVELQKEYPELTYANKGYETLPKKAQDDRVKELAEITELLKKSFVGFNRLEHFVERSDGTIQIRMQHAWSESYTGVGYFSIDLWNEDVHKNLSDLDD